MQIKDEYVFVNVDFFKKILVKQRTQFLSNKKNHFEKD